MIEPIVPPVMPKELEEIIRQYGDIITTYKRVIEVWTHPPTFQHTDERKVNIIHIEEGPK